MMKKAFILKAILSAFLCIGGNVFATLSGSGTEVDPYLIQSRADFDEFADPNNATLYWMFGTYTKLMCDLNLSDTTYTQAVVAPDMDHTDWGFQGTEFTGIFDGNGHVISNLNIVSDNLEGHEGYYGLFGVISENGYVSGLEVQNVNIQAETSNSVGGLVACNRGEIYNCSASGIVSGRVGVGILVGENWLGTVSQCYASGTLYVSYASGGAIVGQNNGIVEKCFAMNTTVTGTGEYSSHFLGILVGENESETAIIVNCYSSGLLPLVGVNADGTISNCYTMGGGKITPEVPWKPIPVLNSFWDTEVDGEVIVSEYGTGLPSIQMRQLNTYLSAGWDFVGETTNGSADIWRMCVDGVNYPKLTWQHVRAGDFACPDSVSTEDLSRLSQDWLLTYITGLSGADANGDKIVNLADFSILASHWLKQ